MTGMMPRLRKVQLARQRDGRCARVAEKFLCAEEIAARHFFVGHLLRLSLLLLHAYCHFAFIST